MNIYNLDITTILIGLFVIILFVFSSVRITYKSSNEEDKIPIDLLDERTNTGIQQGVSLNNLDLNNNVALPTKKEVAPYNAYGVKGDLWGLPEKDEYMTPLFREQIDYLKDRYYRDVGPFTNI